MQTAIITGGSRGVGEATALALAKQGFDIALTCREKRGRAKKVAEKILAIGRDAIIVSGDMTVEDEREALVQRVREWSPKIHALVLNASGGLEPNLLAERPNYPTLINRDAQVGLVRSALPILAPDSTIAYVTSHWAHLYGSIEQLPSYEPVAATKHMGEMALRGMQSELSEEDIRLLVVTGDLVDGTITAKLLERKQPGLADSRRDDFGNLITPEDMGIMIANGITNRDLPSGTTIVVGASLDSLH